MGLAREMLHRSYSNEDVAKSFALFQTLFLFKIHYTLREEGRQSTGTTTEADYECLRKIPQNRKCFLVRSVL